MATTPASALMKKALNEQVIPLLRKAGFKGSYPHFRRITEEKVDLVSFMSPGIFGGGFCVGASIVWPGAASPEESNLFRPGDPPPPQKMTWAHGRIRCSLPGMFGGAFYYTDVYARYFEDFGRSVISYLPHSEKMAEHGVDPTTNGAVLVQKADDGIFDRIAAEAAGQLPALLGWFDRMQTPADLQQYNEQQLRENTGFVP